VAESLFGNLAQVPYGPDTNRVLNDLHENDLAELLIWLLQHELRAEGCGEADRDDHRDEPFAMMSANDNWRWLRVMALNNLIQRGTPAATEAIRKLKEAFPNENLTPVEMDSEEFVRQKTWTPLSPTEFLDIVLTPAGSTSDGEDGARRPPSDHERDPQVRSKPTKPVRRNTSYEKIDKALQAIAESRPCTQEEILTLLDGRCKVFPPAEPFATAFGWMAGFRRDKTAARAWLSKRWRELNLPPLPRGPKNPRK
jgi:hypothetical protein